MHYVMLADNGNVAGVLPLDQLPITLDEYNAKLLVAGSSQYKSGYLPYAIVVGWYQLAKDFAYWRASSIGAKTAVEARDVRGLRVVEHLDRAGLDALGSLRQPGPGRVQRAVPQR